MSRRQHGAGSVFWDGKRNRWVGQYGNGYTAAGKRAYRTRTFLTEEAAEEWLESEGHSPSELQPVPPASPESSRSAQVSRDDSLAPSSFDWWESRPVLAHIRRFALARMCSPAAVLGVVIERTLATVPHPVVLPPTIGGVGSLNMFCALVGPSGSGKGAAESAAADAVLFDDPISTAPLGSGEGIAHCYAHPEKVKDEDGGTAHTEIVWDTHSVLFTSPEVDAMVAIGDRRGSTLMEQLRNAYSGERLGFSYADETRKIPLERHQYRFGLVVGVQPLKAGPILNDSAGGTPQRFIWMPTTDAAITDTPPVEPEPFRLHAPRWGEIRTDAMGRHVLEIPAEVEHLVRAQHAARGRGDGHALDGHAMFTREKVAVALAVLDGRAEMTLDDWSLAGHIMHLSDVTRSRITAILRDSQQQRDDWESERRMTTDAHTWEKRIDRVSEFIERKVGNSQNGEIMSSKLRHSLASRDRDAYEPALDRLMESGRIGTYQGPDGVEWVGVSRGVRSA